MAGIDQSTVIPDAIDPRTVILDPPPQPRGALAEIGTGLARGALVGLPALAGQAIQFTSSPGNPVYNFGKSLVQGAQARGEKPSLSLQPEGRGMVTNALASGAEMLAPSLAVPVAIGAGVAAAGASPFVAGGAAIAGAGALFGAQQGQATLDKAEAAGVDPATAQTAARINAAQTFAAQTTLGAVGGKLLGVFGQQMGSLFTKEAGPLAESTLKALTGTAGVIKPLAKAIPGAAAAAVGTEMAEEAGLAAVERHFGIDDTAPFDAAKQIIGPTLGLTALLTPLGLVARGAQARSAQARTATLANGESAPELRAQLAGEYASALEKVNPEAAAAFRQNANLAIQHKLNMDVDSTMFDPTTIAGRVPKPEHFQPSEVPALGRDPRAGQMVIFPDGTTGFRSDIESWIDSLPPEQQIIERAKLLNLGQQEPAPGNAFADPGAPRLPNAPTPRTMFTFPDGTTSTSIADVDAYVNALPENKRIAARAQLLGLGPQAADKPAPPAPIPADAIELHTQVKQELAKAGAKPAAMLTRKQFAESEQGAGLKGQELARAYRAYTESPDTLRELMRQDADAYEALQARGAEQRAAEEAIASVPRNPQPQDTGTVPEAPARTALAEAMNTALKRRDEDTAFAQREAAKARELSAIANIAKGEQLADAAMRGEVKPDANAPKAKADLVADWSAAMTANEMDTKPQARVPFEKKLDALGIDKMSTHQEQIEALKTIVADKKTGQGMRDRVSMLVAKLEADMPAPKPQPKPLEQVEAAATKTDAQVASEPAGALTGRQAVLEGLVQPDQTRVQVLDTLHVRAQAEAAALVANPDPVKIEALQAKLDHLAAVEPAAQALDASDALAGQPPAEAAALGTNIPPSRPETAQQPPAAAAATEALPDNTSRFTPSQQKLLDGLKPGQGGRTGALNRMRDKVEEQMQALLEEQPANFDKKMEKLVAQAEDMEAIRAEALSLDRAERAAQQAAAQNKPARSNEIAQGDSGVAPLTNVSAIADQAADKIAELRAGFAQRLRAGEKLSELEQERYADLNGLAKSIDNYTEGKASPSDAGFVEFIAQMVYEASQPYTKSKRGTGGIEDALLRVDLGVDHPNRVDMGLLAPAALSHKATDVLANLAANGSAPWVRQLAARLQPLVPHTTIWPGGPGKQLPRTSGEGTMPVLGEYDTNTGEVFIYNEGANEVTILHEVTHAATVPRLLLARELQGRAPKNQEEARLRSAYQELEAVGTEASKLPGRQKQYGMTNPLEFVAEIHSNPDFREFLRGNATLWGRFVNAVRRLLGFDTTHNKLLERALAATEPFFDDGPVPAVRSVEGTLARAILTADNDRTPFSKMADAAFKAVLPLKTVEYIAHQVRGMPELVAAGFSRGVDAHQHANTSHQVATEFLNSQGSRYADRTERALRALGDHAKAQAVQREMALIGGEASRIGFDYRKNGKDNLAADKTLSAADKPYMDEIHRRFTQLQKQHPELAKALEDGERLNRSMLINKTSTVIANVMDARAGVARRLAAELERMDPADAKRAERESQVRATSLESAFAAQFGRSLDFLDPALRGAKNLDATRFYDGASSQMGQRLEKVFQAVKALPEGTPLRDHVQAIETMYRAQVKSPYFSLGRDGDYFVKVAFKDIDARTNDRIQAALQGTNKVVGDLTRPGDNYAFLRFNTADEAQALHDKLVLAGEGRVVDTAWGPLRERVNEVSGVPTALRSLLSSLDEAVAHTPGLKSDQAALMKETLTRQILSMLPETASRSASIGRRGIPGYDADFLTSYARRAQAAVNDTAGLYTSRAYAQAAKARADAIDQINRSGSAEARLRAGAVDDEINKRFADSMKPSSIAAVGQLTSLSHSFYLGLSPAFFIRTMAQPWHRGLPIVGSKFGYAQGMGALAQATPVALKVVANTLRSAVAKDGVRGIIGAPIELTGLDLSPKEQAFINELHLRGQLDLGESSQLVRAAMGEGAGQKMRDALRMAAVTAQMAEMSNRLAMGLAAFRLAEQRPGLVGKETSTEYAIRAINLAMDNFDPANTARAIGRHGFAGPLTPLFTQFQNYALQTMQQIARTVHDGFFGQDKSAEGLQRAKEAKRELAGLMATTGMISGALGLPFANAFAGVYNMLMADDDKPEDVRISIRNWASDTFGREVAGVLLHGPANLINLDTSTFGLQGLLPGSDFLASRMLWKERSETQIRSMLGPAISLGMDMSTAVSKMADGYWLKGIEAALPIGLRSYFKAAELARVGYTDSRGNPLPIRAGAGDVAWRALGFQTADKADQGDAARDFITNQKLLQHRRGRIINDYLQALGDPEALADAGQALQRFNSLNPAQPIARQEIAGAMRARMTGQALGMASGIGVAVSRRQLPALLETERFAAMPGR